jgi:hypothetical protein
METKRNVVAPSTKHRDASKPIVGLGGMGMANNLEALNRASYTAATSELLIALANWTGRRSHQPVLNGRTYGNVLQMLVAAMSNNPATQGARDAAA